MVQCTDHERVMFVSHQLNGPASEWWDNFTQSHADAQTITWDEFVQAFRRAHIPSGMMTLKKKEFRSLRQGNRSVIESFQETFLLGFISCNIFRRIAG